MIRAPPETPTEMAYALATLRHPPLKLPLVGLLMTMSSLVFIEPAPYDLLLLVMLTWFLSTGLGIPREIRLPGLLLCCFVLGNAVAALFAPEPLESIRSVSIRTYMALGWLFFVCIVTADPSRVLRVAWRGYLLAATGAVIFGILEYYGYIHGIQWETGKRLLAWEGGLRAKGPFKDPNVFGPFLVPVAIYCVYRLRAAVSLRSLIYLPLFLFIAFGILLSFSRGAWLNFAVALVLFVSFSFLASRSLAQKLNWIMIGTLVGAAAVGVVIFAVIFTSAGTRFQQRAVLAQSYDVKAGGRFYTQKLAIQRIGRSPLGVGPGRSNKEFGIEPHNLYLHVIVEGGWLAGLSFYALMALTVYRATRLFRWRSAFRDEFFVVFACLVGILAQSAFIDSTHWRHFWLMVALTWALIVTEQRSRRAAPSA